MLYAAGMALAAALMEEEPFSNCFFYAHENEASRNEVQNMGDSLNSSLSTLHARSIILGRFFEELSKHTPVFFFLLIILSSFYHSLFSSSIKALWHQVRKVRSVLWGQRLRDASQEQDFPLELLSMCGLRQAARPGGRVRPHARRPRV